MSDPGSGRTTGSIKKYMDDERVLFGRWLLSGREHNDKKGSLTTLSLAKVERDTPSTVESGVRRLPKWSPVTVEGLVWE